MENTNSKKGGRKPKINKRTFNLKIRLDELEHAQLQTLADEFEQNNMSNFIRDCLFKKEIRVVKTDNSLYKVIEWLSKVHSQYRKIGVNYNQTVKQINVCFGENKAALLLKELEKHTINLVSLSEKMVVLTEKLKEKYYGSQDEQKQ